MELYIRSQDRKRLVPNPNLYVVYSKESQCAYIGDTLVGHIGKYATEERALEILDEIQKILEPKTIITDTGNPIECSDSGFVYLNKQTKLKYQEVGIYVYEMPKE